MKLELKCFCILSQLSSIIFKFQSLLNNFFSQYFLIIFFSLNIFVTKSRIAQFTENLLNSLLKIFTTRLVKFSAIFYSFYFRLLFRFIFLKKSSKNIQSLLRKLLASLSFSVIKMCKQKFNFISAKSDRASVSKAFQ